MDAPLKDTKLIVVPADVADTLKIIAGRLGIGFPNYVENVLNQAINADEAGVSLKETVDLYKVVNIQMDAGAQRIPRSDLNEIINQLPKRKQRKLEKIWYNSGRWYGNYLKTKLDLESIPRYLEQDLKLSWNLDDVQINLNDVELMLECVSFNLTETSTNLLIQYLSGLMDALELRETDKTMLRGLLKIRYILKAKNLT
jgi:hypothetical protein